MTSPRERPTIAVGTDGSPGSVQALRWALRQAHATGAEVRVLLAWEATAPLGFVATVDDVDWDAIARSAVEAATGAEPDASVTVTTDVVNGHPPTVLVELSRSVDLLVLGRCGHDLIGKALGSVTDHCTHHAKCPVVVVPLPQHEAR